MIGFIDRLREVVQPEIRGAKRKFAEKTGINYARVSGWFYREKINFLPPADIEKICKAYGLNSAWLLAGEGNKHILPPGAVLLSDMDIRSVTRRIPIVSCVQAGKDGFWEPFYDPAYSLEGMETVETTSKDIGAYAMRVEGQSMAPLLVPGDVVVVAPNQTVHNGNIVALLTRNEQIMVKVWRLEGDIVLLKSYSPDENDIIMHLRDVVFFQKVVEIKKA